MWEKTWGYKEGFAVCTGLLLTGILLQVTIGKINWDRQSSAVSILFAGKIFLFC